jgi:hypothetical protein
MSKGRGVLSQYRRLGLGVVTHQPIGTGERRGGKQFVCSLPLNWYVCMYPWQWNLHEMQMH